MAAGKKNAVLDIMDDITRMRDNITVLNGLSADSGVIVLKDDTTKYSISISKEELQKFIETEEDLIDSKMDELSGLLTFKPTNER